MQSSHGVLLTRGGETFGRSLDKDLVFNKFPNGKLIGGNFFRAAPFDEKEIEFDFTIMKVAGHVIWKYKKSRGKDAKLKLARFDEDGKIVKDLELAKYVHKPDAEGFTKTEFKFDPNDAKATSSYLFWNPGHKGMRWCKVTQVLHSCHIR